MFSIGEASKYLALYVDSDISPEEWKEEILKLGTYITNRIGSQFAKTEVRKRIGFAIHCCTNGWRPTNAVAFLWGCFRNEEYQMDDWSIWMSNLILEDERIREFRCSLAKQPSVKPDKILSYPPGRRGHKLIYGEVQRAVLPKIEDKLYLQLDLQRWEDSSITEDTSLRKEGSHSLNLTTIHNVSSIPLEGSKLNSFTNKKDTILPEGRSKRGDGVHTEGDVKRVLEDVRESWKRKVSHFVSIYGPRNIIFAYDTFSREWRRIDFGSLYFVERFLVEHLGPKSILKGKAQEMGRLPAELLAG